MPIDVTGRPAKELFSDSRIGAINMLIGTPLSDTPIPVGPQGDYRIPFSLEITECTVLCTYPDAGGNLVADIEIASYAAFNPPTHPAVGDSICGSAKPTLTAAQKSDDSTLTGWTTTLSTGTIIRVRVISADVGAATIILFYKRSATGAGL